MKSSIINLPKKHDKTGAGDRKLFILTLVTAGYTENADICILRTLCFGPFRPRVLTKHLKFMPEAILR